MSLSPSDYSQARRISRAIEEYFDIAGKTTLRSTEIYPYLRRKGILAQDRHNGLYLRRFLKRLKRNHALNLIPQCEAIDQNEVFTNWYFRSARRKMEEVYRVQRGEKPSAKASVPKTTPLSTQCPKSSLALCAEAIQQWPIRKPTEQQPELVRRIRKQHPRAYEPWKEEEDKLLKLFPMEQPKALAAVFKRQPSAIRSRRKKLLEQELKYQVLPPP